MSKNAEESRTEEGPVVTKPRSACLVSWSLSANQSPILDSGTVTQTGELHIGLEFWSDTPWEIRARQRKTQRKVCKRGTEMKILCQAPRNRGEMWISGQVPRNRWKKYRIEPQRRSWPTTISRSPILDTLRKSSRMFDKSWIVQKTTRCWSNKAMYSSGDYLSTTMKAAIHLGENYNHNLVTNKNTNFEELKTLFDITQKLILNQKHEINHVPTIELQCTPLMRLPVLHDKVLKLSKAKVRVYSDRVWERCTDIQRPW